MAAAAADCEPRTAKRPRAQVVESVCDALNAGRDPKVLCGRQEIILPYARQEQLNGVTVGEGEQRCYLILEQDQIAHFLPKAITRDKHNPMLVAWEFLRMLPPDYYSIVFASSAAPNTFIAIPDAKRSAEGFPQATRAAKDAETAAGFKRHEDLRLVLRLNAFRFFWLDLHVPLQGAWPTGLAFLRSGFVLAPQVWQALSAKLDGLSASWASAMRASLRDRHAPLAVLPPVDRPVEAPVAACCPHCHHWRGVVTFPLAHAAPRPGNFPDCWGWPLPDGYTWDAGPEGRSGGQVRFPSGEVAQCSHRHKRCPYTHNPIDWSWPNEVTFTLTDDLWRVWIDACRDAGASLRGVFPGCGGGDERPRNFPAAHGWPPVMCGCDPEDMLTCPCPKVHWNVASGTVLYENAHAI